MKVCFIGSGRAGATTAFSLQMSGLVREIALVDAKTDLAQGEAMDLRHGASLAANQKIYGGGKEMIDGSDIVVITAGIRRSADQSRLDIVNANAALFRNILDDIRKARLPQSAVLIVVTNPVDIMTQIATESRIMPQDQVIGLGTLLDTVRFRSLIAEYFSVDPTDVNALVLGEHGDSMVPIWSSATINGVPIDSFTNYDIKKLDEIFNAAVKSGADVITLKGGANWAVGLAIRKLVEAIAMDKRSVMPVSTFQQGALGIKGVCISLPTIIGRSGVQGIVEIKITEDEKKALKRSEEVLREKLSHLS